MIYRGHIQDTGNNVAEPLLYSKLRVWIVLGNVWSSYTRNKTLQNQPTERVLDGKSPLLYTVGSFQIRIFCK